MSAAFRVLVLSDVQSGVVHCDLKCAAPTTVAVLAVLLAADLFAHLDPATLLPGHPKQWS